MGSTLQFFSLGMLWNNQSKVFFPLHFASLLYRTPGKLPSTAWETVDVVHKDLKLPWRKMMIKETFVSRQNDDNTENFEELKFWLEPAISISQNKSKLPGSVSDNLRQPDWHVPSFFAVTTWLYQDAILAYKCNVWFARKAELFDFNWRWEESSVPLED